MTNGNDDFKATQDQWENELADDFDSVISDDTEMTEDEDDDRSEDDSSDIDDDAIQFEEDEDEAVEDAETVVQKPKFSLPLVAAASVFLVAASYVGVKQSGLLDDKPVRKAPVAQESSISNDEEFFLSPAVDGNESAGSFNNAVRSSVANEYVASSNGVGEQRELQLSLEPVSVAVKTPSYTQEEESQLVINMATNESSEAVSSSFSSAAVNTQVSGVDNRLNRNESVSIVTQTGNGAGDISGFVKSSISFSSIPSAVASVVSSVADSRFATADSGGQVIANVDRNLVLVGRSRIPGFQVISSSADGTMSIIRVTKTTGDVVKVLFAGETIIVPNVGGVKVAGILDGGRLIIVGDKWYIDQQLDVKIAPVPARKTLPERKITNSVTSSSSSSRPSVSLPVEKQMIIAESRAALTGAQRALPRPPSITSHTLPDGWFLGAIYNNKFLIQSPSGQMFNVKAGDNVAELGVVGGLNEKGELVVGKYIIKPQ